MQQQNKSGTTMEMSVKQEQHLFKCASNMPISEIQKYKVLIYVGPKTGMAKMWSCVAFQLTKAVNKKTYRHFQTTLDKTNKINT